MGIGTAIAVAGLIIAVLPWWFPPASGVSHSPPQKAVLTLKEGQRQNVSRNPLVFEQDLTFRNVGDGIAKDAVLACGTLQNDEESSHGSVPLIEPRDEVTVHIYVTEIDDDILHRNDGTYCFGEPVLSYTDEAGRHRVGFDPGTGQSSPISLHSSK
jgi:hypothetical protein